MHGAEDRSIPEGCNAALVFANGGIFFGHGIGAEGMTVGEICFNTAMTGYQEILTDPSYAGQIITFTFPHIGNVGCNAADNEAGEVHARGLILRAPITGPSNYRSEEHLQAWLAERGITGICGMDTRALTRYVREQGPQNVGIVYAEAGELDIAEVQRAVAAHPSLKGMELASEVSCKEVHAWEEGVWQFEANPSPLRGEDRRGEDRSHNYPIPRILEHARQSRKEATDAEKLLWSVLRNKQFGVKFRRQHPIGKYIADFACEEKKLVIELDGGQHANQQEYDDNRTAFLEKQGYHVCRFWNNEVMENIEGVATSIYGAVSPHPSPPPKGEGMAPHIVAVDYGAKRNILRCLVEAGCRLTVVPAKTEAPAILDLHPDGVFLSNGPADPEATAAYAVPVIQALLEADLPLFGICMGHQLLATALGCRTEKMHQGHRGANHPVQELKSGRVMITSQNHGFVVAEDGLPEGVVVTHRSLFDGTIQGIALEGKPVFSLQGHPEASPGPHDMQAVFTEFVARVAAHGAATPAVQQAGEA